jgi:mannose/cellobiose epimerase-like protein (N-acyl-D-glucosamine 2-epimerase family)
MGMRAAGWPPERVADQTPVPCEWVRELSGDGVERERATARLHEMLLRVARAEAPRRAVRLEAGDWDRLPDRSGLDPGRESEWRDLVRALRRAVQEELTEHQRRVFTAIVVDGVPLDALVAELKCPVQDGVRRPA